MWATREGGAEVHTVAYVARELGVTWHTVMDAVRYWGQALVDDPARVGTTQAVGVDETKFLAAKRREPTRWVSTICDVARRSVVDVIEGRQGPELDGWLADQPKAWREGVEVTVTDLHEPFRKALAARLPNATAVAAAWDLAAQRRAKHAQLSGHLQCRLVDVSAAGRDSGGGSSMRSVLAMLLLVTVACGSDNNSDERVTELEERVEDLHQRADDLKEAEQQLREEELDDYLDCSHDAETEKSSLGLPQPGDCDEPSAPASTSTP